MHMHLDCMQIQSSYLPNFIVLLRRKHCYISHLISFAVLQVRNEALYIWCSISDTLIWLQGDRCVCKLSSWEFGTCIEFQVQWHEMHSRSWEKSNSVASVISCLHAQLSKHMYQKELHPMRSSKHMYQKGLHPMRSTFGSPWCVNDCAPAIYSSIRNTLKSPGSISVEIAHNSAKQEYIVIGQS